MVFQQSPVEAYSRAIVTYGGDDGTDRPSGWLGVLHLVQVTTRTTHAAIRAGGPLPAGQSLHSLVMLLIVSAQHSRCSQSVLTVTCDNGGAPWALMSSTSACSWDLISLTRSFSLSLPSLNSTYLQQAHTDTTSYPCSTAGDAQHAFCQASGPQVHPSSQQQQMGTQQHPGCIPAAGRVQETHSTGRRILAAGASMPLATSCRSRLHQLTGARLIAAPLHDALLAKLFVAVLYGKECTAL
jgi:hypothetical protein